MATSYNYTNEDFTDGLDVSRFGCEVCDDATLGSLYCWCRQTPGAPPAFSFDVCFERDLDAGEKTQLDNLVAAHDPTTPAPPGRLLAQLEAKQPGVPAGTTAYARDGRKPGEGAGSGTGIVVYSDGTDWRSPGNDEAVATS